MKKYLKLTALAAVLVCSIAIFASASAHSGLDLGITTTNDCEGWSITVAPSIQYSHSGNYKYVPYRGQLNHGLSWKPLPISDSGEWDGAPHKNYQVKVKFNKYKWNGFRWIYKGRVTEGPEHVRIVRPVCHDYDAYLSVTNDCEGLDIDVVVTDFGDPIGTYDLTFIPWTNPYVLESWGPFAWLYTLPDDSTVTLMIGETHEPERCLIVLEHDFEINLRNSCEGWAIAFDIADGGWVAAVSQTSGTWTNPFILEQSPTITYTIEWADGFTIPGEYGPIYEPEECLEPVDFDFTVEVDVDCDGFCIEVIPDQQEAEVEYDEPGPCGEWTLPYDLETATVHFTIYYPDGSSESYEYEVVEPQECVRSRCGRLFQMWLLVDDEGWECYVVSDTHPGVSRYQRICFPCYKPDFVATYSAVGWVDSCDNWELDYMRSFWRKSVEQLLEMNKRHEEGIYYPIECSEPCE